MHPLTGNHLERLKARLQGHRRHQNLSRETNSSSLGRRTDSQWEDLINKHMANTGRGGKDPSWDDVVGTMRREADLANPLVLEDKMEMETEMNEGLDLDQVVEHANADAQMAGGVPTNSVLAEMHDPPLQSWVHRDYAHLPIFRTPAQQNPRPVRTNRKRPRTKPRKTKPKEPSRAPWRAGLGDDPDYIEARRTKKKKDRRFRAQAPPPQPGVAEYAAEPDSWADMLDGLTLGTGMATSDGAISDGLPEEWGDVLSINATIDSQQVKFELDGQTTPGISGSPKPMHCTGDDKQYTVTATANLLAIDGYFEDQKYEATYVADGLKGTELQCRVVSNIGAANDDDDDDDDGSSSISAECATSEEGESHVGMPVQGRVLQCTQPYHVAVPRGVSFVDTDDC